MAAGSDPVTGGGPAGGPGRAATLVALLLIVGLGLGLRVDAALNPPSLEREALLGKDSRVYAYLAESLYERGDWGDVSRRAVRNPNDWSPGTPLFIAATYLASGGEHPTIARLAIAAISAATIVLAFLLARALGDWLPGRRAAPLAGLAAALLVAVYPIFTSYNRRFFGEPLAAFTLAAGVLSMLWAAQRRSPWAWLLPGLWMGLTALVRPEYLIVGAACARFDRRRQGPLHRDIPPGPGV